MAPLAGDVLVAAAGPWGRWQARQSVLLALLKLPIAWFQLCILFLAPPHPFWCEQDARPDLDACRTFADNSTRVVECEHWKYDRSVFRETIISEWDLVCRKSQMANVAQMVFMFGVLLGNVVFGGLADRWGRRKPLLTAIALQASTAVGTALVPCLTGFLVLRFVLALATGGTMVVSFVVCMEIVGGKWRNVVPILYQIPFSVGVAMMAGMAHQLRHWRELQIALAACSAPFLAYYWLVPESPRWLLAVGRDEEALAVMQAAARANGLDPEEVHAIILKHRGGCAPRQAPRAGLGSLLKTPRLRRTSLCLFLTWFATGLSFFGFSQFQGQIGGDIFINVAVSGVISIPGPVICVYTVRLLGRRNSIMLSMVTSAVASLLIMAVPLGTFPGDWPRALLAGLAVLGMSVSFPALYLYSGELLPTVVRNVGLGASSMCARIGSMAAPFVLALAAYGDKVPLLVLGLLPLLAALLIWPLPETKGCALPDSLEDGENFCRRRAKEDLQNANYIQVPLKDLGPQGDP